MASLALKHWPIGSTSVCIWDKCCMGRVYTAHFYTVASVADPNQNTNLCFRWEPLNAERAGPVEACGKNDCALAQGGSDSSAYSPQPTGAPPLAIPTYVVDFGAFYAPRAGRLYVASDTPSLVDQYLAVSYRPMMPNEQPRRWRKTFYGTAGQRYFAPHGATGISSPNGATVSIVYGPATEVTPLPGDGEAWPLRGCQQQEIVPVANGPLSWELSL